MFFLRHIVKNYFQQGYTFINPSSSNRSIVSNYVLTLLAGHQWTGHRIISGIACMRERTFIAVKPDGVQRCLVGQIIQRFEQRGFKLVGLKMLQVSESLVCQHYHELSTTAFYPSLLRYMTSGPAVVMVWEGHNVVQTSRLMVGRTDPAEAQAGTIRGDYSIHISRNVVHASDSVEGAKREIELWFQGKELLDMDVWDHSSTSDL